MTNPRPRDPELPSFHELANLLAAPAAGAAGSSPSDPARPQQSPPELEAFLRPVIHPPLLITHQISPTVTFRLPPRYVRPSLLGSGSFGSVVAATDIGGVAASSSRASSSSPSPSSPSSRSVDVEFPVAIKKIHSAFRHRLAAERLWREVYMLRTFRHQNMIRLRGLLRVEEDVYLVTELMSCDLRRLIYSDVCFAETQIKNMMYQIFCALEYLQRHRVLHRDLKPSNILVDFTTGVVKVADFGLATEFHQNMDRKVVTRWYRSPELLYPECLPYDELIDVWSVGCILAELILRRPLFAGKDNVDQLEKIVEVLGTPSRMHFLGPQSRQMFEKFGFHQGSFGKLFEKINPLLRDLLAQCLHYCPRQRPSASSCMRHPFFADVFKESDLALGVQVDLSPIHSHLESKSYRILVQREIESFRSVTSTIRDEEFIATVQAFVNSDLPFQESSRSAVFEVSVDDDDDLDDEDDDDFDFGEDDEDDRMGLSLEQIDVGPRIWFLLARDSDSTNELMEIDS